MPTISMIDQNPTLQIGVGCERIFTEQGVSDVGKKRPHLDQVLGLIKSGDVLVVLKLDWLGRSLSHLIELTTDLDQRGIGFRSLSEAIDTTSAQSKLMLHLLCALAEFERSLIAERVGLVAVKWCGARLDRKPKLTKDQIAHAKKLIDTGESLSYVDKTVGVSTAILYRYIPAGASNPGRARDLFTGMM